MRVLLSMLGFTVSATMRHCGHSRAHHPAFGGYVNEVLILLMLAQLQPPATPTLVAINNGVADSTYSTPALRALIAEVAVFRPPAGADQAPAVRTAAFTGARPALAAGAG